MPSLKIETAQSSFDDSPMLLLAVVERSLCLCITAALPAPTMAATAPFFETEAPPLRSVLAAIEVALVHAIVGVFLSVDGC